MFNNGTKLVAIIKNGNSLKLTKVIILVATQAVIPLWLLLVSTQLTEQGNAILNDQNGIKNTSKSCSIFE